jgi:hypothetical protein
MKINKATLFTFAAYIFLFTGHLYAQSLSIVNVTNATSVLQYQKQEINVELSGLGTVSNPYDYDEVQIIGTFTSPTSKEMDIDGFYMEGYTIDENNGNANSANTKGYKIRIAPNEVGQWTYKIKVVTKSNTIVSSNYSFNCTATTDKRGFVKMGKGNYLQFENGEDYIPIGENMCWQTGNAYNAYKNWLAKLSDSKGNFIRLWQPSWGLGIEWRNGGGYLGLRKYRENNMAYLDWLFDYCDSKNVYVMLCLQHHGQVSTTTNPNWNESPYNAVNGGMLTSPTEFWTNEAARAHCKNKYRYTVARWGYSRAIMTWELFNEVHWTDNLTGVYAQVAAWHDEMGKYVKAHDAYKRPVSTSFDGELGKLTWESTAMDYTQAHTYQNASNIESALVTTNRADLAKYKKPTLSGEYSIDVNNGSIAINTDAKGIHIHNASWATLYGGGLGTGMTWWWDNYVDPKNLYSIFTPVALAAKKIPFNKYNLKPTTAGVSNAPGDIIISPSNGNWGIKAKDQEAQVFQNSSPANLPELMTFLYSNNFNNQFRTPPKFETKSDKEFDFSVRTGGSLSGSGGIIQISVGDKVLLEKAAAINTTYTVKVPAGTQHIKVDNSGQDWITISTYTFATIGSAIEPYILIAENKKYAAGWLHNKKYTHLTVNSPPAIVNTGKLNINNLVDGMYEINFYDCLKYEGISTEKVESKNGLLTVTIPAVAWDVTFTATNLDLVSTKDLSTKYKQVSMAIYPNPVVGGNEIFVKIKETVSKQNAKITLYNCIGNSMKENEVKIDENEIKISTDNLSNGVYLLDVRLKEGRKIMAFVVTE